MVASVRSCDQLPFLFNASLMLEGGVGVMAGSIPGGVDWFWEGVTGHWVVLLTVPPHPTPGWWPIVKCDKFFP